jgi:hypothetical protein
VKSTNWRHNWISSKPTSPELKLNWTLTSRLWGKLCLFLFLRLFIECSLSLHFPVALITVSLCSRFSIQFARIPSTFSRISRHRSTVLPTLYPQSFRSDSIRQAINSQIN